MIHPIFLQENDSPNVMTIGDFLAAPEVIYGRFISLFTCKIPTVFIYE
jgi:hypothetical protein